jgi:fibrillarin-like rRNA methylase
LDDSPYNIEETFWLFGRNPKNDRVTIHDIVKLIMVGAYKKKMTKQVIVVHNKLVIYNEEQFDMVICKCIEDAQRLHHALAKAISKNKIKSILFMGTASQASISRMYDIIKDGTGWPMSKIWRTTTRP